MFIEIFCLAVALTNVGENFKVHAGALSTSEALETVFTYWFPGDAEFNESCVSRDCPALNNFRLCPNDTNINVLHSVLNTAVDCMRKPICGILMDHRPTPMVTFTTDELLPGMRHDGVFATLPGTCFLTNISNIELEFVPDNNQTHQPPLQIAMFIPKIRSFGSLKLDLSLTLPLNLGRPMSITIPEDAITKIQPGFCGLDMPDGFPNIITLITTMTQVMIERSSYATSITNFLEKYFHTVFRIISNSC